MNYPFVSFVVPVYNASKYLKHCVGSLLNQTFKDIEVVLVDDGSTDGSSAICDGLLLADGRVRVIHQKNQGVSVARNEGLKVSKGKYISFVDADDWIDENVCEIFAKASHEYVYDLFCYSAVYHKGKKNINSLLFNADIPLMTEKQKEELLCKMMTPWSPQYEYNCNTRFAGSSCGKFYRIKILRDKELYFAEKLVISEDVLFNVLAMDAFENVGYTTKTFYHYEQHNDSAQNEFRPNSMVCFQKVIDEIQKWMTETQRSSLVYDSANTLFVHYLFGTLKEDYFHRNNWDEDDACVRLKKTLQSPQINDILDRACAKFFSLPERLLIFLLKKKYVNTLRIIVGIYNKFQGQ